MTIADSRHERMKEPISSFLNLALRPSLSRHTSRSRPDVKSRANSTNGLAGFLLRTIAAIALLGTFLLPGSAGAAGVTGQYQSLRVVRHSRTPGSQGAVVFVHGMWGDGSQTWKNPQAPNDWPTILSNDPEFAGWDSYVTDFDSTWSVGTSVSGAADDLYAALQASQLDKGKPLIFVCHSLGGIVVRQMFENHPALQQQTRFIAFFATPTEGSPWALVQALVAHGNPQYADMRSTAEGNPTLQRINFTWINSNLRNIKSFCGYERDPYQVRGMGTVKIVQQSSASSLCTETAVELPGDHSSIVKPIDQGEPTQSRMNAHSRLRQWLRDTRRQTNPTLLAQYLFGQSPLLNSAPVAAKLTAKEVTPSASHVSLRAGIPTFDSWDGRCLWSDDKFGSQRALTVTAWIHPNAGGKNGGESIVAWQASGSDGVFELHRVPDANGRDNGVSFLIKTQPVGDSDLNAGEFPSPPVMVPSDKWSLVVGSYDADRQKVCMSANGTPPNCNFRASLGVTLTPTSLAQFTMGCKGQGGLSASGGPLNRDEFRGSISHVRVFGSTLSDDEVHDLYVEGSRVIEGR